MVWQIIRLCGVLISTKPDHGVGRYDARVSESLTLAFPARLAPVVTSVVQSLPTARFEPSRPVTASNSQAWAGLAVAGEPVVIPYRIYNPDNAARPAMQASLSAFPRAEPLLR